MHVQPILHIYCSVQIMKTVPWSGLIGIDKHDSLLLVLYTVHGLVSGLINIVQWGLSPMHQLVTGESDNLVSSFTGTPSIAHLAS